MDTWIQMLLTALAAIAGSSGFWAYIQRRDVTKTQTNKLLQGLAYDKIVQMGMSFIERGWVSEDEYADYRKYLYDPYKKLGGNGVTDRVVAEVSNLPLKSRYTYASEILQKAKARSLENDQSSNYSDTSNINPGALAV